MEDERDWSVSHMMAASGCVPASSQPLLSEHRADPTIDIRGPCKFCYELDITSLKYCFNCGVHHCTLWYAKIQWCSCEVYVCMMCCV
jgi:hypothetical protein